MLCYIVFSHFLITCSQNIRPGLPLSINVNILSAEPASVNAQLILVNSRENTEENVGESAGATFEGGTGISDDTNKYKVQIYLLG